MVSNFRVLYRFTGDSLPRVFSTADGGNRRFLRRWADDCSGNVAGRVEGSLYLSMSTGNLIVLDNGSLEFSKVNLPSHIDTSNHGINVHHHLQIDFHRRSWRRPQPHLFVCPCRRRWAFAYTLPWPHLLQACPS